MIDNFINTWPEYELVIEPQAIYEHSSKRLIVMHEWERPIMESKADFICKDGGHILELGFGMGISATAIQQYNIKSHTICEMHPQIIKKLKEWQKDKLNVKILEGDWYDNIKNFEKYDGILFDTYRDPSTSLFKEILSKIANVGCKVTWWNNRDNNFNQFDLDNTKFRKIKVNPPKNNYFNKSTYWMPQYLYTGDTL